MVAEPWTSSADFIPLSCLNVDVDLRYASANNFVGRACYVDLDCAYLHKIAAEKLAGAAQLLQQCRPDLRLKVLDALRPRRAHLQLWAAVEGTPDAQYVADPREGSVHSYGFAVDLTLFDPVKGELDMGSGFDEFDARSEPRREAELLAQGRLSAEHYANRRLLRQVMTDAGFLILDYEWWHFNALPPEVVRQHYPQID